MNSSRPHSPVLKKVFTHGALFLLGGILFVATVWLGDGFDWSRLKAIQPLPFAGSILLTISVTLLVAVRWRALANTFGKCTLPLHRYYKVFAYTSFVSFILPKDLVDIGGRLMWMKKKGGHSYTSAGTTLFWDRLMDAIVLFSLLPGCLTYFLWEQNLLAGMLTTTATLSLTAALLWFSSQRTALIIQLLLNGCIKLVAKMPFIKKKPAETILPPISRRLCLKLFALSAGKPILLAGQYVFFAYAMGLNFPLDVMLFATPVSQLAFVFSFTAGGLGVLETGWFAILTLAGIQNNDIGIFLVGQRLLSIAALAIVAATAHLTPFALTARKG